MSQMNFGNYGPGSGGAPPTGGFGGGFFDQFYGQYQDQNSTPNAQNAALQGYTPVASQPGMYQTGGGMSSTGFDQPTYFRSEDQFGNAGYNQGRAQFGAALLADYQNLVQAGNLQGERMQGAMAAKDAAYTGGAENIRQSGNQAFDALSGKSDQMMDMGNQFLADQTEFNQGVLAQSDSLFEQAADDYQNQAASDASSQAMGIARQRGSQRNQLASQAKMGDPQAQAALAQMDFQTGQQTQQAMSSLASQYNQVNAQMGMARAQNYGQVGMQAGSNINQAGSLRNQMASNASSLYQQGVVMRQGAEVMANQFLAQGMESSFRSVADYPQSPVSIASIFSQMFQLDMTPGTSGLTGMPDSYMEMLS